MAVTEGNTCDNHKENTETDNNNQKKMNNIQKIKPKSSITKEIKDMNHSNIRKNHSRCPSVNIFVKQSNSKHPY